MGFTGKEPDELAASGRESGEYAHDLLKMFYNNLNLASKSKMAVYQSIRSFYGANRVILGRKPRTFRASAEYEPRNLYTQDDVATLVDAAANDRDKAMITFLAQSGQRVGIVTGLKLRHVDLVEPSPLVVEVPPILRNKHGINVNKSQSPYRFAVGEDTKKYLKLMIQDRKERGEPLGSDSWLFRSHSTWVGDLTVRKVSRAEPGEPISVSQIGNIVRTAAVKRGIQQRFGKRYLFHLHGSRARANKKLKVAKIVLQKLKSGPLKWTPLVKSILQESPSPWKAQTIIEWLLKHGYMERPERGLYRIMEKDLRFLETL